MTFFFLLQPYRELQDDTQCIMCGNTKAHFAEAGKTICDCVSMTFCNMCEDDDRWVHLPVFDFHHVLIQNKGIQ